MNRDENRKKENDSEERWYARMNEIEDLWRTKISESRIEYLEDYNQTPKETKKQSESFSS